MLCAYIFHKCILKLSSMKLHFMIELFHCCVNKNLQMKKICSFKKCITSWCQLQFHSLNVTVSKQQTRLCQKYKYSFDTLIKRKEKNPFEDYSCSVSLRSTISFHGRAFVSRKWCYQWQFLNVCRLSLVTRIMFLEVNLVKFLFFVFFNDSLSWI